MPYLRRPYAREAVHIVGEAYSGLQGWVEGALCEAEKMLQEHFGGPSRLAVTGLLPRLVTRGGLSAA